MMKIRDITKETLAQLEVDNKTITEEKKELTQENQELKDFILKIWATKEGFKAILKVCQ